MKPAEPVEAAKPAEPVKPAEPTPPAPAAEEKPVTMNKQSVEDLEKELELDLENVNIEDLDEAVSI